MVEAARTGAIDFHTADPGNPLWWEQALWVLDDLEQARELRLAEHYYQAMLVVSLRAEKPAKLLAREYEALSEIFLPWRPKADPQAEVKSAEQAWARQFGGQMTDPEIQARINMTVDAMLKGGPRPKRLGGSTGARRKRRPPR